MTFPILPANSQTGYNLTRSLRFRASASAYLSRTPASAGDTKIHTRSFWVKRGALGSNQYLSASTSDGFTVYWDVLFFNTSNVLRLQGYAGTETYSLISTQVFRDPSAWYHIVIAFDTTQATASNRIKVYVNGTQVTAFTTASYPAQNTATTINSNCIQYIGQIASAYFDGYMAEWNNIVAQQLTPSSFGSTNSTTGVWQPAAYTGTYGTNGFYLPFTDNSALTTSSNVGLGKDFSGNGNYWVTNNISITAGVTYDSMTDVPTLTSATAANFAVLNPLDKDSATVTLTNGNLNWASGAPNYNQVCRATIAVTSGKWYWEVTPLTNGAWANMGVCDALGTLANASRGAPGGWVYQGTTGNKANNNSYVAYGATYTNNDVIGVALDMDGNTLTFYKNGVSQGVAYSTGFTGKTISPLMQDAANDTTAAINFGQRPFAYTPPTGFVALNAYNLPDSTIKKGNTVMDATLYTGNLTGQTITNTAGFKPDLVWPKSRSAATDNKLVDSVRGATLAIVSNSTAAETTDLTGVVSFNSNGFTLGTSTTYNNLAATYVAWQWQAGQGSSSSNTNGTITSTVSVNASAGFSVVTYTGTGANATVGHGLGVAPSFVIVKSRGQTSNWMIWHSTFTGNDYIELNTTTGAQSFAGMWNSSVPTSSVINLGSFSFVNGSGITQVAYCWAEIAGFSKFGKYTGNGSADGTFVYLGFKPKYVLMKRADASGTSWIVWDSVRGSYNLNNADLFPNLSDAEFTSTTDCIDMLSNGFKLRGTGSGSNASGGNYIYAAFAENPFKNSLAR